MRNDDELDSHGPLRVLICDDEQHQLETWENHIKAATEGMGHEVTFLTFDPATGFDEMLEELTARRRLARGIPSPQRLDTELALDTADIVVLDYDILRSGKHAFVTGEELAYLARCYSSCGAIVSLNQIEWIFDLRLWNPDVSHSFADVNIRSESLQKRGLWQRSWVNGGTEFRPWSWPILPELVGRLRNLTEYVSLSMDERVLPALGLDRASFTKMVGKRALDAFHRDGDVGKALDVTFESFLDSAPQGKKPKDVIPTAYLPRVIASRILNWLWNYLLPSQDVIVDQPHLAYRVPEVLDAVGEQPTRLNELAQHYSPMSAHLVEHQVQLLRRWLPFPVWSWPDCARLVDPFALKDQPQFVFCEDTSNFQSLQECQSVETDVGGSFATRWVYHSKNTRYGPRTRLFR